MAVEDTPWFIGAAGVLHPAKAARAVAYAAANGSDGVIGSTDLKVTARPTPNGQVLVAPGGVNLISRYPGASSQAYTGVVRTQEAVSIDSTSSAGGRSDLVVARVRDPQYGSVAGYDPANPNNFGFFTIEVVKGVSSSFKRYTTELGYPAMALARIDIPASTATITNAMITDLRFKSAIKTWRRAYPTFPTSAQPLGTNTADWLVTGQPMVSVPVWATTCNVICHIEGIYKPTADYIRGEVKITVGGISTDQVSLTQNGAVERFGASIGGSVAIPVVMRGTTVPLGIRGVVAIGPNGGYVIDSGSGITFDIEFLEGVE